MMATAEHIELSAYIKKVHTDLRQLTQEIGATKAWQKHTTNADVLQKYAACMKKLATTYWSANNSDDPSSCRVSWILKRCEDYFLSGGKDEALRREVGLSERYCGSARMEPAVGAERVHSDRLCLLDVGSCYNPFSEFPIFEVTAVDLAPACAGVMKCDFLNVAIGSITAISEDGECSQLEAGHFDAVVFSLVLEYLPSAEMRYEFCRKAYRLLRPGGLLLVVTPDSKHATANARTMVAWKRALASIGFWRVAYEKLRHLHCMAFRKSLSPEYPHIGSPFNDQRTPERDVDNTSGF